MNFIPPERFFNVENVFIISFITFDKLVVTLKLTSTDDYDYFQSNFIICIIFIGLQVFSVNSSHSFSSKEGRAVIVETISRKAQTSMEICRDLLLLMNSMVCLGSSVRSSFFCHLSSQQ